MPAGFEEEPRFRRDMEFIYSKWDAENDPDVSGIGPESWPTSTTDRGRESHRI